MPQTSALASHIFGRTMHTGYKQLELLAVDKFGELGVSQLGVFLHTPQEFGTAHSKGKQAGHLEGKSCHENVGSQINLPISVGTSIQS